MISFFGLASSIIAIVSIAALVLHHRLIEKRGVVDDALAKVNELLFLAEDEEKEALDANSEEIDDAARAYNDAVVMYNAYISKFPGKIIAFMVGLKQERGM